MPGFIFGNTSLSFETIKKCIKKEGIQLSSEEKQALNSIFEQCDVYDDENKRKGSDGALNHLESIKFINLISEKLSSLKEFCTKIFQDHYNKPINFEEIYVQKTPKEIENLKIEELKETVKSLINTEIEKRKTASVNVDIDYWADKIAETSQKYDIPSEIIVSIISRETNGKFNKNINCGNGAGPMQITGIAVKSFFPSATGGWNDRYQSLDAELLNDILYQKDEDGNFKTDENGNKILAYSSAKELRNACGKDDELGVKVGTLIFEMKYVESVAIELFGRYTYANVKKVIDGLKDGTIKLTEAQKEKCLHRSFVNYNGADGIKENYGKDVIDSLRIHNFNFEEFEIFKE